MKYLNTVLLLYMQVTLFVWLNAKIEKISTKDTFENYGFFCTILYYIIALKRRANFHELLIWSIQFALLFVVIILHSSFNVPFFLKQL